MTFDLEAWQTEAPQCHISECYISDVMKLLRAACDAAVAATHEADCKAVCKLCCEGAHVFQEQGDDSGWFHFLKPHVQQRTSRCVASPIRKLMQGAGTDDIEVMDVSGLLDTVQSAIYRVRQSSRCLCGQPWSVHHLTFGDCPLVTLCTLLTAAVPGCGPCDAASIREPLAKENGDDV